MVVLQEKSAQNFQTWNGRVWRLYREELIQAGYSESAADENVQQSMTATMDDAGPKPGNFIFDVVLDGVVVGDVWLNQRDGEWFIYDIEVRESQRGKGLGRATMRAIEHFVREHNGTTIGLSVFGFNKVAQNLYLSEGYDITRLMMQKNL